MLPLYLRDEGYRYNLKSHPSYYFRVGRAMSKQLLWGLINDEGVVIEFDPEGRYMGHNATTFSEMVPYGNEKPLGLLLDEVSRMLQRQFPIEVDCPITISRFWLSDLSVGIEDLGDDLKEFTLSPAEFSNEEVEEYRQILPEWLASGMFALQWDNSFYVNAAGEIETS